MCINVEATEPLIEYNTKLQTILKMLAAKMTLLQFLMFLKPAFAICLHFTLNQMDWTERVNCDPTFCATTKIHRSVGISLAL